MQLRDYKEGDFEQLWRIDQQCFPPGISYSRRELAFYIRRRDAFTLVAEQHNSNAGNKAPIVGFIVVHVLRGAGHVITIDVSSQARRHGIGSSLLQAAEERLRAANCHTVGLETAVDNTDALVFYRLHGYAVHKVIPRYYSNGVDALRLRKELA